MKTKLPILLAIIMTVGWAATVSAEEGRRGALFQIGAGTAVPFYPSETEAAFSFIESGVGVERIKIGLNLALGFGISQNGILMARIDGMGDRLYDVSDYIQLNMYLYSLGYRFYPSATGFYLESGVGMATCVMQSSSLGQSTSDPGFGYGAGCGYVFNHDINGFSFTIEAKYNSYTFEGDSAGGISLVGNLCWK